jgi:hypothetical protein
MTEQNNCNCESTHKNDQLASPKKKSHGEAQGIVEEQKEQDYKSTVT